MQTFCSMEKVDFFQLFFQHYYTFCFDQNLLTLFLFIVFIHCDVSKGFIWPEFSCMNSLKSFIYLKLKLNLFFACWLYCLFLNMICQQNVDGLIVRRKNVGQIACFITSISLLLTLLMWKMESSLTLEHKTSFYN